VATKDGGHIWIAQTASGRGAVGVSCPTSSDCYATGSGDGAEVLHTTDGGSSWTLQKAVPANLSFLSAVSCPSKSTCTSVGENDDESSAIIGTTDSGSRWTDQTLPNSLAYGPPSGVSCPAANDCWAVGLGVIASNSARSAPASPTEVTASTANEQATVSWNAPSTDSGSLITSYTVVPSFGCPSCTGLQVTGSPPATITTITGLTAGSNYTFQVVATNAVGTSAPSAPSNAITPMPAVIIAPSFLPVGEEGTPYSATMSASGGQTPYKWGTEGAPPSGLEINPSTGVISGTPTGNGSATFDVTVTDSSSPTPLTATQPVTIYVAVPDLPLVTGLSTVEASTDPTITISGINFGASYPYLNEPHDSSYLELFDCSSPATCTPTTARWRAGYTGDLCNVTVEGWTDTDITLQLNNKYDCKVSAGQQIGVQVWNTKTGGGPGIGEASAVSSSTWVWGYCLNVSYGAVASLVQGNGWGCAVESSPTDVALLVAGDANASAWNLGSIGGALETISNELNCSGACASAGIFAFGSDATSTAEFGTGTQFPAVTVGGSIDLGVPGIVGVGAGAGITLFSGSGIDGALYGYSLSGCVLCVPDLPGISFGNGGISWTRVPLSGTNAEKVSTGLQDMQTATLDACASDLIIASGAAACPFGVASEVGSQGADIQTAYNFLSGLFSLSPDRQARMLAGPGLAR
jgi:hypothetical protein